MKLIQLTPHFNMSEFLESDIARRNGIANSPGREEVVRIAQVAYLLEILRAAVFRKAIVITSGFRSQALNVAVGGVENSAHRQGWAADFRVIGTDTYKAADAAHKFLVANSIPFDQIIYEKSRNVIHLSLAPEYRAQALTQAGGPGTPFQKGIVP